MNNNPPGYSSWATYDWYRHDHIAAHPELYDDEQYHDWCEDRPEDEGPERPVVFVNWHKTYDPENPNHALLTARYHSDVLPFASKIVQYDDVLGNKHYLMYAWAVELAAKLNTPLYNVSILIDGIPKGTVGMILAKEW